MKESADTETLPPLNVTLISYLIKLIVLQIMFQDMHKL